MLHNIFRKHHCDKHTHGYATLYEHAATLKNPKSIMEIGFMHGASMMAFRERFPAAELVALEINIRRDKKIPTAPFQLIEGDFRRYTPTRSFDWIIDDGSHHSGDVIAAFHKFWPFVNSGGFYIIEDTHTSYWPGYADPATKQTWSVFIHWLIDDYVNKQGVEAQRSETRLVIFQKSIVAIQKP